MACRMPELPAYAAAVLRALEGAGFEAWVVGGWVRDALLGSASHDVDVCTAAPWQESERALLAAGLAVHRTGTQHGTVTAVSEGKPVEVTTYRVDGAYSDARHPDSVRFVRDVREDLARRDFTINAMAYHPERGLLDMFGGADDLATGLVRAVGEARERFDEDALRVLRAVRFAARYGFDVEERTHEALAEFAPRLALIAQERIGQELTGIFATGRMAWALERERAVMVEAIPELKPLVGFAQNSPYHAYDAYEHTVRVVRGMECVTAGCANAAMRWAALLHDVAKPATYSEDESGRGHFFGHPELSAEMASSIMRRMAVPGEIVREACALIRLHDRPVTEAGRSLRRTVLRCEELCPGRGEAVAFELLDLKRADDLGKARHCWSYCSELDIVSSALRRELSARVPLSVRDLAVNGSDVIRERGLEPGPGVGVVLEGLLSAVVEDGVPNTCEALMELLRLQ